MWEVDAQIAPHHIYIAFAWLGWDHATHIPQLASTQRHGLGVQRVYFGRVKGILQHQKPVLLKRLLQDHWACQISAIKIADWFAGLPGDKRMVGELRSIAGHQRLVALGGHLGVGWGLFRGKCGHTPSCSKIQPLCNCYDNPKPIQN